MMPSKWTQDRRDHEAMRCKTCHGLGELNDADIGDISYVTWPCEACKGSGYEPQGPRCKYCNGLVEKEGDVHAGGCGKVG